MTLLQYCLALGLAHLYLFKVAAQPQPCGGAAFAKVGKKLYIQGGATSGDNLLASLWALDLTTSWSTSQPAWNSLALGPFNAYHSAGYSSDNSSFITFGRDTAADPQVIPQSWVNVYDIATNAWTFSSNPANMNDTSRRDFSAVTNPSANKVYVLGGDAGPGGQYWSNMFSTYDITSRTLTESPTPAPGPQSISTYAAVWVPRLSAMLVIGGALQSGSIPGLYVYRPDTGTWSIQATTGSFTYARTSHCAASNADGSIVAVYGGFISKTSSGDPYVYLLDTRTWTWTATLAPGRGRGNIACTIVDDTFIIWGGFYNNPNTVNGVPLGAEALLLFQISKNAFTTNYTPSSSGGTPAGPDSGSVTPTSNSPTGPTSNGLSTAVIGGIIAGACAILLVAAFTIYNINRRNNKMAKQKQDMLENPLSGSGHGHGFGQAGYRPPNDCDSLVPHRPTGPTNKYSPTSTNKYSPGKSNDHDNRPSVDDYTSSIGYSDPATPTTLQFLAMGEPGGHDSQYIPGRQSYMSDGSVFYPPPPSGQPPIPGSNSYYSQASSQGSDGRRVNDPQSIVSDSSYGGIGPPYQSEEMNTDYHDGGYKHQSMMSSSSGISDASSSNPHGFGYLDPSPYAGRSPPVPKRPVNNPQGGHVFGSVVEQPVPGAPQAILQHQLSQAKR
ncbi:hypothetical protein CPB97_012012 [Podila verticillata]|nr:hypothetical protein CPB97_012012 [Podila verticillata]